MSGPIGGIRQVVEAVRQRWPSRTGGGRTPSSKWAAGPHGRRVCSNSTGGSLAWTYESLIGRPGTTK